QEIAALEHSSYAIRPLREGFLYLLIKRQRAEAYEWHSQYRVAANGSLQYISADSPWEPAPSAATLDDMIRGFGWAITLYDLDDLQELRPLFSPTPLTPRMLDNYRLLDDEYRSSLPAIDIQRFIQPADAPPQPHVLKHDQLDWVADFRARYDPQLQALLDQQPFNSAQIVSFQATYQALAPRSGQSKPRGAAIVIEDALGITQELNAWRNAAIDDVRTQWLQRTVEPGVDNERKLLVAQSFLEVETLYPQMVAERTVKREVMAETVRSQPPMHAEFYGFTAHARQMQDAHDARVKPHLEQFELNTRAKAEARLQAGEFKARFDEKYGQLVDRKAMHAQLEAFEQTLQQARQAAQERAQDHVRWLTSERLLQALDRYDNADLSHGLAFAEQTGLCVIGMELAPPGARLLERWWRGDPYQRSNLAVRGVTFNQDDLREELVALREAAKAMPPEPSTLVLPEALARQAHVAANAFARINTLHEQLQSQNAKASVGLYGWFALLGQEVLRTAAPNSMDHALHHGLRLTLLASVHHSAVEVRLAETAHSDKPSNPRRVAGQVSRYLDQAWAEGLMQASDSHNDFYKVRAAAVICLLEGMLMAFKAQQLPDSDARFKTELLASAMTTAAAGFEIGASYVEQVVTRFGEKSVSGKGAAVALGRLKLWGAGMAGMGGFVLAWWDLVDGHQRSSASQSPAGNPQRFNDEVLSKAYYTRALATITLSLAETGTAIALAKPFFDHLAKTNKGRLAKLIAQSMSKLAAKLGTDAARLLLTRLILGAFWIGLVTTFIIFIFEDDALEKWCKRSSYRLDRNTTPYADSEELPTLHSALSEVI
ncbi:hypothetical protein N5D31_26060, partial [Pseudomonas sp. GD03867]|uniref:T6SS effector BTH_I2691 family protein n=2 Tax=unclassified Pseudomonas TaxID=196821 RepID=UPI002446E1E7